MDIALTMLKFPLKMGVQSLVEMILIFCLGMGIASRIHQNPLQCSVRQNKNRNDVQKMFNTCIDIICYGRNDTWKMCEIPLS